MHRIGKLALAITACLLLALPAVSFAQDMTETTPVTCDTTLVTLLMIAEHDYDYLSHMDTLPNIDFGQYTQLIHDSVARMQSMEMDMSADEMATATAMQATVDEMMMMSTADLLSHYDMTMGMGDSMSSDSMEMMALAPGDVAGEDPLCTSTRADVEHFLLAHVLADIESMSMDSGM